MSLNIEIYSLSLKKNSPLADKEHGYSFVFDLRCLPNPGRFEEYKNLSGKDLEVANYLNAIQEVNEYYSKILEIINLVIPSYLSRNFDHLSIGFGCTGGQHRSVYFAERLAQELANREGVNINLRHLNLKA